MASARRYPAFDGSGRDANRYHARMNRAELQLLAELSEPGPELIESLAAMEGDLMLLGAGGKIGHGIALMAKRAFSEAGKSNRVIAVSRFSDASVKQQIEADEIETITCDLTDVDAVRALPDAANVLYMVGHKFGTGDNPGTTWVLNTFAPAVVAQRFAGSRIVAYSSGNIYPFTPIDSGGPDESTPPDPVGEYGASVLGRERIFEYYSRTNSTPVAIVRLNYANEPRYGVLVDIATKVQAGEPVDVTMGYVNVVWTTDANRATLRCFELCDSPPAVLNLAGPDTLSVRDLAQRFGEALGVEPVIKGQEAETALLSNGAACWERFGEPEADVDYMIERIAGWLMEGNPTWNRPTHFEVRSGKF